MSMLRITVDGVSAVAEINVGAEVSAEHIFAVLPMEVPLEHATRSGNCAVAIAPELIDASLPIELQVSMYYPNMIAFDPVRGYLVLAYGQGQARSAMGTHWVTHLGTVLDGAELAVKLQNTRDVGKSTVRFEKIEKGA